MWIRSTKVLTFSARAKAVLATAHTATLTTIQSVHRIGCMPPGSYYYLFGCPLLLGGCHRPAHRIDMMSWPRLPTFARRNELAWCCCQGEGRVGAGGCGGAVPTSLVEAPGRVLAAASGQAQPSLWLWRAATHGAAQQQSPVKRLVCRSA